MSESAVSVMNDDLEACENIDEFRLRLAGRISSFMADARQAWRECEQTGCQRARRCLLVDGVSCSTDPADEAEVSDEEESRAMFEIRTALQQEIARRIAENEDVEE
jgi:hypothetical protein